MADVSYVYIRGCYVRLARSADRLCARPHAFRGRVQSLSPSLCKHSKRVPDVNILIITVMWINVNELLSGERIMTEVYDKRAEENLLEMRRQIEEKNRQLLRTEYLIVIPAVVLGLVLILVASFIEIPSVWRGTLIFFAVAMIVVFAFIAVGIEQKAGYYECQKCHDRHVPTFWQTNLAPHIGRTRYMKCPACGRWSYQKKVLTKEE